MLRRLSQFLILFTVFSIPIEHKYDKLFRHFSLTLIPHQVTLPIGFDKKIYFYISDITALLLFTLILLAFRVPLRRLVWEKGIGFLWIFFLLSFFSILASPLASYPVVYTRLFQLFTPIVIFLFLAHVPFKTNITQSFFVALIAAALVQAAIASAQYFVQAPLGLRLLGEPSSATGTFFMPDGHRWIFDQFASCHSPREILRASGTLPHCNVLGGLMALSMLASYAWISSTSKRSIRTFLGLSLSVQLFALSVSFSRSALFAWVLSTLLWFGYCLYHKPPAAKRYLATMIGVAVVVNFVLLSHQYFHRGGIVNYNQLAQNSDQARLNAQQIASQIIWQHPFLGVGFQQFNQGASDLLPSSTDLVGVHNIYLFIAAEMGVIALIAFLCFLATLFRGALRAPPSPKLASLLAMFVALLFIGGCDFYPFLFHQGKLLLFCVAGFLAVEGSFIQKKEENCPKSGHNYLREKAIQ